jgi:hypothetical protein
MSRTPRRYDAEEVRRFSDTTIAYYDQFARAFWNGTRNHDVNQNYAAFLDAIASLFSKKVAFEEPDVRFDHATNPILGLFYSVPGCKVDARPVKERRAEGATLAELARSYGVGKSMISRL